MVKLFRRTLRENIDIQLRYEQGNERIFVDPSRIQQVLMNLGVNARDAMPDGGKLTISINQIVLAAKEAPPVQGMMPGSWVVIDIHDTGSGMPQETISRIFEPFFSTKEIGSGTGLGLAQVYDDEQGWVAMRSGLENPIFYSESAFSSARRPVVVNVHNRPSSHMPFRQPIRKPLSKKGNDRTPLMTTG
jgi:C4-dicarboxylate-specific signal transduction histidine kinase